MNGNHEIRKNYKILPSTKKSICNAAAQRFNCKVFLLSCDNTVLTCKLSTVND